MVSLHHITISALRYRHLDHLARLFDLVVMCRPEASNLQVGDVGHDPDHRQGDSQYRRGCLILGDIRGSQACQRHYSTERKIILAGYL